MPAVPSHQAYVIIVAIGFRLCAVPFSVAVRVSNFPGIYTARITVPADAQKRKGDNTMGKSTIELLAFCSKAMLMQTMPKQCLLT